MGMNNPKKQTFIGFRRRFLAFGLVLCLILSSMNVYFMRTYAGNDGPVSFEIGVGITAVLEDGRLTISGQGAVMDFTEQTAPFVGYAKDIHTLVINDGITYIGAFLFYGLGELGGELTLPASITGIGDYALSGPSLWEAPGFSLIQNEFVEGQVLLPAAEMQSRQIPIVGTGIKPVDKTESESGTESETGTETETGTVTETGMEVESGTETEIETVTETGMEGESGTEIESGTETVEHTQIVTQQQIPNPETLFYKGQTGSVICSDGNLSFIQAAQYAGYERADGFATVTVDDMLEMQLPVSDGRLLLPECPEGLMSPYADEPLKASEFAGWRIGESGEATPVLAAGEAVDAKVDGHLKLYSVWTSEAPAQSNAGDNTPYSQPVQGIGEVRTVYVAQNSGDDTNGNGSESNPFKTLEKAITSLMSKGASANDPAADNQIILLENYNITKEYGDSVEYYFPKIEQIPVTIMGKDSSIIFAGRESASGNVNETNLHLNSDVTF